MPDGTCSLTLSEFPVLMACQAYSTRNNLNSSVGRSDWHFFMLCVCLFNMSEFILCGYQIAWTKYFTYSRLSL